jgi:uncharacterized membrane protein YjjB (DUF3815 family)
VVTANIVMLLAGIGFMGALQDALSGFYVTGGARLTEALLSTAGIIAGVSGGLPSPTFVGVEVGRLDPGAVTEPGERDRWWRSARRSVRPASRSRRTRPAGRSLPIAVVAALAIVISHRRSSQGGFGRTTWPTALAAFFVGLVSYTVSRPAPGAAAGRRGVGGGADAARALDLPRPDPAHRGDTATQASGGILALVTAASVALALASGVILGEYVAQPLKPRGEPARGTPPVRTPPGRSAPRQGRWPLTDRDRGSRSAPRGPCPGARVGCTVDTPGA